MDAAGNWDRVAPAIAARGYRVLAPDLRGFGDGPTAPPGSYYHFNDYVADVAALVDVLAEGAAVSIVGHSMGGMVGLLYAGTFPERVTRLANLEGLGPPDNPFDIGPTRMRKWLEGLRDPRSSSSHAPMPLAEARRRLVTNHPRVPPEVLEHRLPHLVREVEGGVVWRFDPLHRTTSPSPFFAKLFLEFAKRITCPCLFVSGGSAGYHPPDEAERLTAFTKLEMATLEDAGHMMHWTQPEQVARCVGDFLDAG
jgi:pimeloyl-ACP methyl ester carboxylesterase